jgi:hypothetical protein
LKEVGLIRLTEDDEKWRAVVKCGDELSGSIKLLEIS